MVGQKLVGQITADGEWLMAMTSMSDGQRLPAQLWLPPGFRFDPTDQELIFHYLLKKVKSETFEIQIIGEVNLLEFKPWDLPGKALFGERMWYFFTSLERKYPRGTRPNRATDSGYWKATGIPMPIKAMIGGHLETVGSKRSLVFYLGKSPQSQKTEWIMHEYRLAEGLAPPAPPSAHSHSLDTQTPDNWVLCMIKCKRSSSVAPRDNYDVESMLSQFDEQMEGVSATQEQDVVDDVATTSETAAFTYTMHDMFGAVNPCVSGMGKTIASSSDWNSHHNIASSSQHARFVQEHSQGTGTQSGQALSNSSQLPQFHQPPSSFSFTAPHQYNAVGAGQGNSLSRNFEEVESQLAMFTQEHSQGTGTQSGLALSSSLQLPQQPPSSCSFTTPGFTAPHHYNAAGAGQGNSLSRDFEEVESQLARFTQEHSQGTGTQSGLALSSSLQLPQQPPSSCSFTTPGFTAPHHYNAAGAGQGNSLSGDFEEVQSQSHYVDSCGEGELFPGLDYLPAGDQSSTPGWPSFGS